MKNYLSQQGLIVMLSSGLLLAMLVVMVVSIVIIPQVYADEVANPLREDVCAWKNAAGQVVNVYNDPTLTTEEVMTLYHTQVNAEFNRYITLMIEAQTAAAASGLVDPRTQAPEDENVCRTNPDQFSTFCVAKNLLSNPDTGRGYIQYAKALDCRRNLLFESVSEQETPGTQLQVALQLSTRLEAIDREIRAAKETLDHSLAAYDELKTAWPMHQRYMQIYDALVKYRDKLVEIRHHVEDFPSEFIDATTLFCT